MAIEPPRRVCPSSSTAFRCSAVVAPLLAGYPCRWTFSGQWGFADPWPSEIGRIVCAMKQRRESQNLGRLVSKAYERLACPGPDEWISARQELCLTAWETWLLKRYIDRRTRFRDGVSEMAVRLGSCLTGGEDANITMQFRYVSSFARSLDVLAACCRCR